MAEGTSLLRTRTGNCTEGSNPSLSALFLYISRFPLGNSIMSVLMNNICKKILKAFSAFERSLERVRDLDSNPDALSDDQEERWEAYCSRFARLQDMLVKKFFRGIALHADPAWSRTVRDLLNLMEKLSIIDSANDWIKLRELRNEMAHEYEDSALQSLQERARQAAPPQ